MLGSLARIRLLFPELHHRGGLMLNATGYESLKGRSVSLTRLLALSLKQAEKST